MAKRKTMPVTNRQGKLTGYDCDYHSIVDVYLSPATGLLHFIVEHYKSEIDKKDNGMAKLDNTERHSLPKVAVVYDDQGNVTTQEVLLTFKDVDHLQNGGKNQHQVAYELLTAQVGFYADAVDV